MEWAMFGFKKFYSIQQKRGDATEIMPAVAIKRAFSAISLAWNEFQKSQGVFKISDLGTMLQEQYHALGCGMAGNVDTIDNTINCIIRSNIILEIHERQGSAVSGRIRYSVGGTHYNPDLHLSEFLFEDKPEDIIERLEKMSTYENYTDFPDMFNQCFCSFIETIASGSLRISCTNKHFHYGRKIISREITNSIEIKNETNIDEKEKLEDETFYEEYKEKNLEKDIELIQKLINEEEEKKVKKRKKKSTKNEKHIYIKLISFISLYSYNKNS